MSEIKSGELTQNLYRWAIVQRLATELFNSIQQPLVKYHSHDITATFSVKHAMANPKDKKAKIRIEREYKAELSRLSKDFSEYSKLNKNMVKAFSNIEDNDLIKNASNLLQEFLSVNVQITQDEANTSE